MNKYLEQFLICKRDSMALSFLILCNAGSMCFYFFVEELLEWNVFKFSAWFFMSLFFFFYVLFDLKRKTPKFKRGIYHICCQGICLFTCVMVFYFHGIMEDFHLYLTVVLVNYFINRVFILDFGTAKIKDLFDEKKIKELEKEE